MKGSRERVATDDFVIKEPERYKGSWSTVFGNHNPIHLEIGMGKGRFIIQMAEEKPGINYIGIEKYSSVLLRALDKRKEIELSNLYFLRFDAEYLTEIFGKDEVDRIYLNFSDPWPKDRHAKRRLTSKEFLSRYEQCLKREGQVIFKTDNRTLFDFSLEQAGLAGWETKEITYDLHHSDYLAGNVMTEYEERFAALGNPIHRLVMQKKACETDKSVI